MNNVKTVFLLVLLTGLLIGIGYLVAGMAGAIFAFILSMAMNVGSYWFSDKLALQMTGAREVSEAEAPDLHRAVENVSAMAGLPKPRVYIIQNDSPNAFATGRNSKHAAVAATTGILRILDDRELTAVFGHELGHIRNKDILINAVVATVAGAITFLATMLQWSLLFGGFGGGGRDRNGGALGILAILATIILAPFAAAVIRMAISRQREYGADSTGAQITHAPLSLASALQKLEDYSRVKPMQVNPAFSHLFIVNPLGNINFANLFSTHPPIEQRIERLNQIARKTGNLT
ncbi:MAG TPA: zinc metalloprotease HtpX [Dehalococcoidia bacterium]|nr:zinc metalloprotease HtpX [Dehalococcoidia bacterium]